MDSVEMLYALIRHACDGELNEAQQKLDQLKEWKAKGGYNPPVTSTLELLQANVY